jgi:hypothetical protein
MMYMDIHGYPGTTIGLHEQLRYCLVIFEFETTIALLFHIEMSASQLDTVWLCLHSEVLYRIRKHTNSREQHLVFDACISFP